VPAALYEPVQTVASTTYSGSHRLQPNAPTLPDSDQELQEALANPKPGSAATVPVDCATMITPAYARAVQYVGVCVTAMASNVLPRQVYEPTHLTTLMTRFRPDATPARFTVVQVNEGWNDQTDLTLEVGGTCLGVDYSEFTHGISLCQRLSITSYQSPAYYLSAHHLFHTPYNRTFVHG